MADADKLSAWLADNVAHAEHRAERVREELLKHCREEKIEPPTPGRTFRIVQSALHNAEKTWSVRITARLGAEPTAKICALVGLDATGDELAGPGQGVAPSREVQEQEEDTDLLALIKSAPGNVSVDSMMSEITKLEACKFDHLRQGR